MHTLTLIHIFLFSSRLSTLPIRPFSPTPRPLSLLPLLRSSLRMWRRCFCRTPLRSLCRSFITCWKVEKVSQLRLITRALKWPQYKPKCKQVYHSHLLPYKPTTHSVHPKQIHTIFSMVVHSVSTLFYLSPSHSLTHPPSSIYSLSTYSIHSLTCTANQYKVDLSTWLFSQITQCVEPVHPLLPLTLKEFVQWYVLIVTMWKF